MCCNHHNNYRQKGYKWYEYVASDYSNNNCKSVCEITNAIADKERKHIINDNYDYCCCAKCLELSQVVQETITTEITTSIIVGNNIETDSQTYCKMCRCHRCLTRKKRENDTIIILRNKSNYSRLLCNLVQNNKHYHHYDDDNDTLDHYQQQTHSPHDTQSEQLNFHTTSNNNNNNVNGLKFLFLILTIISLCIDSSTAGT